jgi:hypothetical protein
LACAWSHAKGDYLLRNTQSQQSFRFGKALEKLVQLLLAQQALQRPDQLLS